MKSKYITFDLFSDIEEGKEDTKIAKLVYNNVLNLDKLSIIECDNVFWIEKTCSWQTIPNYAYKYIKKWGNKRGLVYLYDLPCKY